MQALILISTLLLSMDRGDSPTNFVGNFPIVFVLSDKDKEVIAADAVKKIEEKKDQEIAVKGAVQEVFLPKSGSVAILNFGKDSKKCFKAVVFKADFEKFEGGAEGIKKRYQGKVVKVEGKVSIYQGMPQIIVNNVSQLTIK